MWPNPYNLEKINFEHVDVVWKRGGEEGTGVSMCVCEKMGSLFISPSFPFSIGGVDYVFCPSP